MGLRSTSLSYKNKKLVRRPESEQLIVENTHLALITQELWDIVQDVRQHKKRIPKQMEEPNLFSGLAFCADCGKPMVLHRASTMKRERYNFTCYTYGKRGKNVCSPHHIREDELCKIVLDNLQRATHFARLKERQFAAYINQENSKKLRRERNALQKELDAMRKRDGELSALFKRLYEDHVLQRFTAIDQLTPELVRLFVQRIEIGARPPKGSRSAQGIKIVYRDIGCTGSEMEPEEYPPQHLLPPIPPVEELVKMLAQGRRRRGAGGFRRPPRNNWGRFNLCPCEQ